MKKKLLVSILIANYNKEKYIDRGIKSGLKQTYKNIEIIFVDDSSNDNSFNEAKKFKKIKENINKLGIKTLGEKINLRFCQKKIIYYLKLVSIFKIMINN